MQGEDVQAAQRAAAAYHGRERNWLERRVMALSDVLHLVSREAVTTSTLNLANLSAVVADITKPWRGSTGCTCFGPSATHFVRRRCLHHALVTQKIATLFVFKTMPRLESKETQVPC